MSKKDENFKFGRKDMLEYEEYIDQLSPEEQKYVRQFYLEYYAQAGYYMDPADRIIQSKEGQKEANRNHNALKTEAMEMNRKNPGKLSHLGEFDNFMNEVSDDQDWEMYYSLGGPELAFNEIMYQTLTDLENNNIDKELTLARFHSKMLRLGKMIRREKKENR